MSIVKKAMCGTVAVALSVLAVSAQAQTVDEVTTKPRAVLFKVHDIKPVENTEGVITHCDFLVTFYNRTTESLRQAKIDMNWTDTVSDRYMVDANETAAAPTPVRSVLRNSNQPTVGEISTSVDMPALGSYKQASVKGSVKTEKCFLLLDSLDFKVATCSVIGQEDKAPQVGNRRGRVAASRNVSECANLFEYVDSKNPEYYDEFQNISYSDQERLIVDEKKQDIGAIESSYEGVVKNFEKATNIMNNIK